MLVWLLLASCNTTENWSHKGSSNALDSPPSAPGSARPSHTAQTSRTAQTSHAGSRPQHDANELLVGKELVERFECARCHDGTGATPVPLEKHCVHCHQAIHSGQFQAPASVVADWQRNVSHLLAVPTLDGLGTVVEQSWIENYLLAPHDLRPALAASMPKLPLSRTQARAIAAYLEGPPHSLPLLDDASASASMTEQRLQAGRQLFHAKGCPNCHSFEAPAKPPAPGANPDPARRLAPDLRWTRHRIRPSILVAWIKNPQSFRPDTLMPNFGLTHEQALNLASYVLRAELSPIDPAPMPKRLPILTRPVSYAEVSKRVLKKVCWHCHAQPDFAEGDGGPGMSGGFGFAARELDLSSYSSIMAGYRDRQAKWTSVFRRSPDGTPVLVEVLLRRQAEERGASASLRGMPLGLPALSPTEIQLVETWVAQGHPP